MQCVCRHVLRCVARGAECNVCGAAWGALGITSGVSTKCAAHRSARGAQSLLWGFWGPKRPQCDVCGAAVGQRARGPSLDVVRRTPKLAPEKQRVPELNWDAGCHFLWV